MSELSVGTLSGLAANGYVIDVASGSQLTQPGMILQVVESQAPADTTITTTGTSYVSAGVSASITPKSTNSKILVYLSQHVDVATQNNVYLGTVFRAGSSITPGGDHDAMFRVHNSSFGRILVSQSAIAIDSPATTSEVTYEAMFYSQLGGEVRTRNDTVPGKIILMEVAA